MRPALLLLLLLLVPAVNAISLMNLPSQREYTFEPGLKADFTFAVGGGSRLIVTPSTPVEMHPETAGTPLDDNILNYVTVEDNAPGTGPHPVTVHIALPQEMKPGQYPVNFIASEMQSGEAGGMTAVARVAFQLQFWVLSDEKRLDVIEIIPYPTPEGMPANISVRVASRTKKVIDAAFAEINVYDGNGTIVKGTTLPVSIASAETTQIYMLMPTEELVGGDYFVNATVRYDGKSAETGVGVLKIGTLHVDIPAHSPNITYNTTNKFLFTISNKWNKELQDVYATIDMPGQERKKTASMNIPAFGSTAYDIYFDRDEALLPGATTVNVTVNFKDYNPWSKQYVVKAEDFFLPVDVVLPPVPPKKEPLVTPMMLFLGSGVLLLLAAIILLIWLLRRRPKDRPPAQQPPAQQPPVPPPSAQPQVAPDKRSPQSSPAPAQRPVPPASTPTKPVSIAPAKPPQNK